MASKNQIAIGPSWTDDKSNCPWKTSGSVAAVESGSRVLLSEMGQATREAVFSGRFPARSYLYSVRHFTRVKGVTRPEAERFVSAVAGHGLSGKQVDQLAQGYFQGSPAIRAQIEEGKLAFALETIRAAQDERARDPGALGQMERGLLRDFEIATSAGLRITRRVGNPELRSPVFFAQAELLTGGLERLLPDLESSLKNLAHRVFVWVSFLHLA